MKNLALALIALMIAPSLAFAGGGNSKDDPTIKVINGTDHTVLVILDQEFDHDGGHGGRDAFHSPDENGEDGPLAEFLAAGGVVLEARGDYEVFDVKAGLHTVHYYIIRGDRTTEVDGGGDGGGGYEDIDISDFTIIPVFVNEGQNKKVTIRGGQGGGHGGGQGPN